MTALTALLTVFFLGVTGWLGYLGFRSTRDNKDYLVAGRSIHPYIMALSYGATFISTSAIVGFSGAASVFGLGLFWLTFLNIFVGIFIAFVFFGERVRRMGHILDAHTFPEFLGRRFNSRAIQVFSGSVIFIFMPLYAAVVMMGAGRFLQTQFGIPYESALLIFGLIIALYVIIGGLKGVMFTDAFQGSIMVLGMLTLLVITYIKLGGVGTAHASLAAMEPGPLAAKGHQGWTSMPALGSELWWVLVSTIILGVGIGVLAQPQLVVRFMTVESKRELNRAVAIGGIFILLTVGIAYIVGNLSNVFFLEHPEYGKIAVASTGGVGKVLPVYIKEAMPAWFSIVFMLTLLSAAMSTLSSQFHSMGSAISHDIYESLSPSRKEPGSVSFVTRLGIGGAILLAVFIAWALPAFYADKGAAIIARGTAIFFGICAATFLPVYIASIYWRKATRTAALASMITGFVVSLFCLLFIHDKEAAALGLCKALFGRDFLITSHPWMLVDPVLIALPVSILVLVIVSFLSLPFGNTHLDSCFSGDK